MNKPTKAVVLLVSFFQMLCLLFSCSFKKIVEALVLLQCTIKKIVAELYQSKIANKFYLLLFKISTNFFCDIISAPMLIK